MKKGNFNSKKIIWYSIAALVLTISSIFLLVSGLQDSDRPIVIVAAFTLLLDLIMIVAFAVDCFRKR